ncbi:hypothetical protein NQ317_004012 [Molorchus minor]|uniref:Uncharacterized protein n=1 Tax=Molorchus minor TaxID=1323400 RepID=A0ABQ9JSJ9_9CUCU|nr:hypothetical protein NQ317_004012 [Molorchus minor]
MEAHFGKNMPDIFKIMQNVSIVFNNVNPITSTRALGPNFILFGDAVHLQNSEPLPKDLQEYLDGAEKGRSILVLEPI